MVGCNFGLIAVGKTLFKEVPQKVGYCQKTRKVCAFKAQLSSAGYFCKTLSSVKLTTTLICTFDYLTFPACPVERQNSGDSG